jgi:xylose isomerase
MAHAGILDLARPTLDDGETIEDLLAGDDDFDVEAAATRDYGFVRLQQLALEHLIG